MAWPALPHHADNRRCGCVDFEAASTSTATRNAPKGFYTHVANFSGRVIHATPKLSVQDDAAAHTRTQRHAHNRAMLSRRTLPHLSNGRRVSVVFKNHRPPKCIGKRRSEFKRIETRDIWNCDDLAGGSVHGAGHYD